MYRCKGNLIRKNKMKVSFLTAAIRKSIPKLYATDGIKAEDKLVYVKYFHPYGAGTWLAFEFDGEDTFFGSVNLGHGWELGYFSLTELSERKAKIGGRTFPFQAIERDRHFGIQKYSEAIKE
jgi:hypothetical protein